MRPNYSKSRRQAFFFPHFTANYSVETKAAAVSVSVQGVKRTPMSVPRIRASTEVCARTWSTNSSASVMPPSLVNAARWM